MFIAPTQLPNQVMSLFITALIQFTNLGVHTPHSAPETESFAEPNRPVKYPDTSPAPKTSGRTPLNPKKAIIIPAKTSAFLFSRIPVIVRFVPITAIVAVNISSTGMPQNAKPAIRRAPATLLNPPDVVIPISIPVWIKLTSL